MALKMKPGFDGSPFGIEKIRDLEGHGKRELLRRIRYDVVERLYRYNPPLLTLGQRDAAVRLQCEDQLAKTPVMASAQGMGAARSSFGVSEAVLDARAIVRGCEGLLGRDWALVAYVVLANQNLGAASLAFDIPPRAVLPKLRKGLDKLAGHFGQR